MLEALKVVVVVFVVVVVVVVYATLNEIHTMHKQHRHTPQTHTRNIKLAFSMNVRVTALELSTKRRHLGQNCIS